jgi:hypothetical protein
LILGPKKEEPSQLPPLPQTETKRDSVADIAKKSFSEATKSSPAPFIPPRMSATLRGASSFFSGGEGSRTFSTLSSGRIIKEAKSASTQTQKKSLIGAQSIPGYKGVASESNSVNKGAFEKLRTAADKAAGYFSGADAKESLEKAASSSLNPSASEGFGALRDGGRNTNPSGSSLRGSFSFSPGDPCRGSIEAQLACENARKANEFKNWLKYDLPKSIIQSAVDNIINKGIFGPIGEKVANTTKSMLNPQPPSPPPAQKYCWITATKKIPLTINKDNNGNIQIIPPVSISDCPCGLLTTEPYPECGGGSSGSGTSGGQSNSSTASPSGGGGSTSASGEIDLELKNYDALLKKAIESANKGELATTVGDLKQNSGAVAKSLIDAGAITQKIANFNISKIDSKNFKTVSEYKLSLDSVEKELEGVKKEYNEFIQEIKNFSNTLDKAINEYNLGKIKPKFEANVGAETLGGSDIPEKLKEAKARVEKIKKDSETLRDEYLVKFEQRLTSHLSAYTWYVSQIRVAKDSNKNILSEVSQVSGNLNSFLAKIDSVSDNAVDEASINTLKEVFNQLTGHNANNVLPPKLPAKGGILVKNETPTLRMSPSSDVSMIDRFLGWRSADKEQAWAGNINDKINIENEMKRFNEVKPSAKLASGEYPRSFENLPIENSFVISLVRAMNVDMDVEESKKLVSKILDGIDGFKTSLGANKTELNTKIKKELEPLLSQLQNTSPAPVQQPSSSPNPLPSTSNQPSITINVTVGANASSTSGSSSNVTSHQTAVTNTQVKPKPNSPSTSHSSLHPSHPSSSQSNSQQVMKYQSLLNVYIDNIKELRSKMRSLESEKNIAYEVYQKCLNSWHIYSPLGCKKKKNAFNKASQRFLDAMNEVRQAKQNCEKFKSSVPVNIRKQLIGECN